MKNKFAKYIEISKALLPENPSKNKHFSFIVLKNRIMSIGINSEVVTHPLALEYEYDYPFQHSELSSIVRFPEKTTWLSKCTLINVRLNKSGIVMLSYPCLQCQILIRSFNFKQVYYTDKEGEFQQFAV